MGEVLKVQEPTKEKKWVANYAHHTCPRMQGFRARTSVWPEAHLRRAGAPRQTLTRLPSGRPAVQERRQRWIRAVDLRPGERLTHMTCRCHSSLVAGLPCHCREAWTRPVHLRPGTARGHDLSGTCRQALCHWIRGDARHRDRAVGRAWLQTRSAVMGEGLKPLTIR
jgi:hypothetical protein